MAFSVKALFQRKAQQPRAAKSFDMTGSTWPTMWGQPRISGTHGHTVVPEANSAVTASLRWAMKNVVAAPITIERLVNNNYEVVANHPAQQMLSAPNPYMTGRQMMQGITLSLVLEGNAYIYKVRNGNDRLVGLQYLPHGHVTAVPGLDANGTPVPISKYEYRAGSKTLPILPGDMIHIKDGVDPLNSALGWSGLRSVVNEILTDDEASAYTYAVLKNLGVSGFIMSPMGDDVITEDQAEKLKKLVKAETTGDNRGEPIVLSQAVQIDTKGYSPEEMALDKMRRVPQERILAIIGINGMVLGLGSDDRTYSNYAEARSAALEDWMMPTWACIDETLTNQLLPEFGLVKTERVGRDTSKIKAFCEDESALTDRLVSQYYNGICKRAEARQALGYPTTPEDDVYFLDAQAALITDGQAKAAVKADIVAKRTARDLTDRGY